MTRPTRVGLFTFGKEYHVEAIRNKLASILNTTVVYKPLPYNDFDKYRLERERGSLDKLVLVHSIKDRRFAITDIMDALYDRFLDQAKNIFGKGNVSVIASDFPWPFRRDNSSSKQKTTNWEDHPIQKEIRMNAFRSRQPSTFKCASVVAICGSLGADVEMDDEDWSNLETFVKRIDFVVRVRRHLSNLELTLKEQYMMCAFIASIMFFHVVVSLVRTFLVIFRWLLYPIFRLVIYPFLYGPDVGTLFKFFLILALLPWLYWLWISVDWRKSLGKPRDWAFGTKNPPQWARELWWKVPFFFWLHYINVGIAFGRNRMKSKPASRI